MHLCTIHGKSQHSWLKKKKKRKTGCRKRGNAESVSVWIWRFCILRFFVFVFCFLFFYATRILGDKVIVYALFMGPTTTLFRKNIKNWSHGTIYQFKNYFATVFSVFSKINCIQTDPPNCT